MVSRSSRLKPSTDDIYSMKLIRTIALFAASILAFFQPVKIQHGEGLCCAECAFKKEDEIEVVDQQEEKTEA